MNEVRGLMAVLSVGATILLSVIIGGIMGNLFDMALLAVHMPSAGDKWNQGWWTAWIACSLIPIVWRYFYPVRKDG